MRRLALVFLLCLLGSSLFGCSKLPFSVKEVHLNTPLGLSVALKLEANHKVQDLSSTNLGKIPFGAEDLTDEPGGYRPIYNLKFAIWIPEGCKHQGGRDLALDPGYNRKMQNTFEEMTNNHGQQLADMPFNAQASVIYLDSHSEQFACGNRTTAKIVKGSVLSGRKITASKLNEIQASGITEPIYPDREIRVTAVKKSRFSETGYFPSPANLILWSDFFCLSYDVQSLYVGKDSNNIFLVYQAIFENVEIENRPQTLKFQGVKGVFEGSEYIYFVNVLAQIGPTTAEQWKTQLAVLESFRYQ